MERIRIITFNTNIDTVTGNPTRIIHDMFETDFGYTKTGKFIASTQFAINQGVINARQIGLEVQIDILPEEKKRR